MSRGREAGGFRRDARDVGLQAGFFSLEAAILALSPYSWMEADYYSVDGGSGKVSAFLDKVAPGTGIKAVTPTHAYAQGSSPLQVAVPTADATLNGKLSANFTAGPRYVSNAPPSAWRSGHDGTGFGAYVVLNCATVTGVQFVFGSYTVSTAGLAMYSNTTIVAAAVRNAIGTIVVDAQSSLGVGAVGAASRDVSHAAASTPDMTVKRNGASAATANATGGLAAGDPGSSMVIGDISGGIAPLNAKLAMVLFFNRAPSAQDEATVAAYRLAKYGRA